MKLRILVFLFLIVSCQSSSIVNLIEEGQTQNSTSMVAKINQKHWFADSYECRESKISPLDKFKYNSSSYILRQNKCLHYEAPFMYLLMGKNKALLVDTGVISDTSKIDLYGAVKTLMEEYYQPSNVPELLVLHSHSHSDHTAADSQFIGKPKVTLVRPDKQSVRDLFDEDSWPNSETSIDLGERLIRVLAAPGHHSEGLAFYDYQTGWLLSGDTLFPGRLVVDNWSEFRQTIKRLANFARNNPVSAILGGHVETYAVSQRSSSPRESGLALDVDDLFLLEEKLYGEYAKPGTYVFERFTVTPAGVLQKTVNGIFRLFSG